MCVTVNTCTDIRRRPARLGDGRDSHRNSQGARGEPQSHLLDADVSEPHAHYLLPILWSRHPARELNTARFNCLFDPWFFRKQV